ncbi:MAG: hypothetical protein LPK14_03855 [Hymenobacteraceae bacterium]|nr:hypothetical protein [Hymenobacteraceae bacterium]
MKTLLTYSLLAFLFFTVACQRSATQKRDAVTTTATLLWTGEIAADGCGFEMIIDGKKYLPENEDNIPAQFKESESSQIRLTYIPLQEPIDRQCGMLPKPRILDGIRIVSIEKL